MNDLNVKGLVIKILFSKEQRRPSLLTEYLNQEMPTTPTMTPPMTAPSPMRANSVLV